MSKIQWSTADYLYEYPQHAYFTDDKMDSLVYPELVSNPVYDPRSPSASPLSQVYGHLSPLASPDSLTSSASGQSYLEETVAKAAALPESFYPPFLQYSKESFESVKKRARTEEEEGQPKKSKGNDGQVNEIRRQIHIQSEQKRRAQIKDGFEGLRAELPTCLNKKMSKVTLLNRTVQHIQHLKNTQINILSDLQRLVQENEQLRSFQQSVLQKQALETIYHL
ncbi:hypothetical protein BY458DRAFT_472949 [Sporodiniella umbellata]|nr:hypothetical protein BY458DRAFT_472949 [Sporodiniella umbellata]